MNAGYDSLKRAVERDCNEGCGCFNPEGCNVPNQQKDGKSCFHAYCDKFKWVIDRAKHYGEVLQVDWREILNKWEESRTYWYMNYYQDANQPLLNGDRIRVFDTVEDMLKSVGNKGFRCPACGGVSTNPYACNSNLVVNKKICDWKVCGLFGDLGKGVFVFCKDKLQGETIFMPIAWEEGNKSSTEQNEEQKKAEGKMFEFHVWIEDGSWEGWNRKSIVAQTASKAKYAYFLKIREAWDDLDFKDFLKKVRCKKVGLATLECLYTDKREFERMCQYRNIPFAYQGMRVEVDGNMGTIIGNYDMNLLVVFDGSWRGENCHPHWQTRYFDRDGNVVADYTSKDEAVAY